MHVRPFELYKVSCTIPSTFAQNYFPCADASPWFRIIHTFIHPFNFDAFPFPFLFFHAILFPYPFRNAPKIYAFNERKTIHIHLLCDDIFFSFFFLFVNVYMQISNRSEKQTVTCDNVEHTHTCTHAHLNVCSSFLCIFHSLMSVLFFLLKCSISISFAYFEDIALLSNKVCIWIGMCVRVYRKYSFYCVYRLSFVMYLEVNYEQTWIIIIIIRKKIPIEISCMLSWYWKMMMKMK